MYTLSKEVKGNLISSEKQVSFSNPPKSTVLLQMNPQTERKQ